MAAEICVVGDLARPEYTIGQQFLSFDELNREVQSRHKSRFGQVYIRDCRSIVAAAKRAPDRCANIPDELKYYDVRYCCIHGGKKFKSQGSGLRTSS